MKKYLYPYPKRKEIEIRNISFALITFTYEQFTTTFFIYSKENDKIRFETTNNYLGIAEVLDNLKIPIFIEDFEVQHCIDEVEKIRLYTELNVIKKKYSWRRSSDVRYIKNQIKNNDFKVLHRI